MPYHLNEEVKAHVKRLKTTGVPTMSFPLFKGVDLPFQAVGAEMAYLVKRLLLMDPTGLGKTAQGLMLASKIIEDVMRGRRRSARILVAVEPDHVKQWADEVKKFIDIEAMEPLGDKASRKRKYELLASRDVAVALVNHSKLFVDFDWIQTYLRPDAFIVDEAAVLSNKNKTHQFATWVARLAEYVMVMSAEPITRGDLVQIRNCFQVLGIDLMDSEEEYVDKFVDVEKKPVRLRRPKGDVTKIVTTVKGVKAEAVQEFKELIYFNALRRPKTILGERRIINRQLITVEMTPLQRERYAEVVSLVLSREGKKQSIDKLSVPAYLSQVLSSPTVPDPSAPPDSPKGEALVRLLQKIAPEKLIIFSKWKRMHAVLAKLFEEAGINAVFYSGDVQDTKERYDLVKRFNEDPSVQAIVFTQAGQKGLNLQHACNSIALVDLLYSPTAINQIVGRADRFGQKSNVINLYIVVAEGSREMKIMSVLHDRQAVIDTVNDEDGAQLFGADFAPEELYSDD